MDPVKTLRFSKYFLWGVVFGLPLVAYWASSVTFGTVVVQAWLPGDDAARTTYRDFVDRFGDDQILFLTWPDCTLDDPRLERLSRHLRHLSEQSPALGIVAVNDSRGMIGQLTETDPELSPAAARQRLSGIAIGADGSCFIALQVAEASNAERAELIETLQAVAQSEIEVTPDQLILAGEPFQVHVIDQASRDTMRYFVAPSSVIALFVAWLCLGRWRITFLVFILAGVGQLIGLALIAVFLGEMSAVLVVLPTLVFMLTLSASIHLANYYRECGGESNRLAGSEALALGIGPCILATLTTVFGFSSLVVSQLKPVWHFGALASVGLLITTACLLSVFPAAISLGSSRRRGSSLSATPGHTTAVTRWLTDFTGRYATYITGIGIVALLLSSLGVTRLKTSTEFEDMFPPSSPAMKSLRWVQAHLGPIASLEFLVAFDKPPSVAATTDFEEELLARVQVIERVHHALERSPHTASVLSAITFLPSVPRGQGIRSTIRRAVLRTAIGARLPELQMHHLLADLPAIQQWRLSVRVHDLTGDNYSAVQSELRTLVEDSFAGGIRTTGMSVAAVDYPLGDRIESRPSLSITGLRAVIEKAHFALLSDLGGSFLTAFLLIAPVMMLIVRSVRGGLLLMIPNVLPVALVFGSMGWLQIKLDVASILTASVALGIAVDDTLHFVTWYIRQRRQGSSSQMAVRAAISHCARPMLHTTLICTGSMLPFFFSDFLPTSKFALLMVLVLSGAIVGDLVLLPAILQSPLGNWLVPGNAPGPKAARCGKP